MGIAPDRYDELRRQWIHDNWWHMESQRRRYEKLDIQIRRRLAAKVLAAPSRRDDLARDPLLARGTQTWIGALEAFGFWTMLLFIPLGWFLGRSIYKLYCALVPGVFRSYPLVPMLWYTLIGVLIPIFFDPGPGLIANFAVPYLLAQLPAAFLVAGVYGIAEGWLAVPGALQWSPRNLPELEMNAVDAAEIIGADDITAPPMVPPRATPDLGTMTPEMRQPPVAARLEGQRR
ncbi:hypothetical protein ONA92_26440 [Mycobacteroides salmoniphilum]|uniref:hypothetical protein n=1 Tax=Mycobacteroides salmoniphilum TaxID=404941 RepID=UPI00356AE30B